MRDRDQIIRLILGDCFEQLRKLPNESVGAVVTDPPYFLSFMNAKWDQSNDPMAFHRDWLLEAFRVLQPGGIIKVFSGTRTKHRLEAAIEAVGFILVGECGWLQGQGFPKSLDLSKAVEKQHGVDPSVEGDVQGYLREQREALGLTQAEVDRQVFGGTSRYTWVEGRGGKRSTEVYLPTPEEWTRLKEVLRLDDRYDAYIQQAIPERDLRLRADGGKADLVGETEGDFGYQQEGDRWGGDRRITRAASPEAQLFEGWGTALKPSWEPFCIGQKPAPRNEEESQC